jgi:hypothetical protein
MASWMIKAAAQHMISWLPGSYWWNGLFQKYLTKGYYPRRETFAAKLSYCRQHLDHYLKYSPAPQAGVKALEVGTGAWPIVPLGLYLCGASEIWTYDLVPFLRRDTLRRTLELFDEFKREGALERVLVTAQPERVLRLEELLGQVEVETPVDLLRRLNIHVHIGDARTTELPEKSVDLAVSTVAFEMIGTEILSGVLAEFKRVASADAVISHYVGLSDQYADFDKSITPYNFMKYSDRRWRLLNNPIIPQSRLRIADYRELFKQTGWDIVEERSIFGSLDDLKKIQLAAKFQKYSIKDLLVRFSWLVARPSIQGDGVDKNARTPALQL